MYAKLGNTGFPIRSTAESEGKVTLSLQAGSLASVLAAANGQEALEVYNDDPAQGGVLAATYRISQMSDAHWPEDNVIELTFDMADIPASEAAALRQENAELKAQVEMLEACLLEMSEVVYA